MHHVGCDVLDGAPPSTPLQGEVVEQQFGEKESAFHTLDL